MEIIKRKPTSTTGLTLKRVAAYARVSSDKTEADQSLAKQISYYNEKISQTPGWLFAGVYADEGISGTKNNRPEFQQMLTDARAGKIDLIITKSITRFARNTVTLLEATRELKKLRIDVFFEKEKLHSISPDGELLLTLLAQYAEEEARSASENKRWQIRRDFEEGRPTYVRLYGYKWVDGKLQIVPEEAEMVKRIYSEYLSGKGIEAIARRLNDDGVPSLKSRWYRTSIYSILRNEKYAGDLLLQKWHTPDFRTKKQYANHGQWRQYFVEADHEAIIDRETFTEVQLEIEQRKRQTPKSCKRATTTLFAGLITCKTCGSKYIYKNNYCKSSHTHVPTWFCSTHLNLGKSYCSAKQIRESILIDKTREVLGLPEDTILTREMILAHISAIESAAEGQLRFFFIDGSVKIVKWENPSRRESWTPEMKQKAREQTLARYAARKEDANG